MGEIDARGVEEPRSETEGGSAAADPAPALAEVTSAPSPLRLMLADNAPTRTGMRLALPPEVSICADVGSAEEAIRSASALQPDACFIGRELLDGELAPLRGVCRAAPGCSVVVFAAEEQPGDMVEAIRAGALGYVPGALTAQRLRVVVRAVTAREAIVPRALIRELVLAVRDGASEEALLTGREAEVLRMLRRGQSTRDIAERLRIAPVTVRRHISELVRKLGVRDRAALVAAAGIDPAAPTAEPPPA